MLTFAIAIFFALALIGSLLVIGLMVFAYREQITAALLKGLDQTETLSIIPEAPVKFRQIKPRQVIFKYRGLQPPPLSVAA